MPLHLPYRTVSLALAILLLAAAALKLHGLAADSVAPSGVFSTPEFQLANVEFEAVLAIWLISGKFPFSSWLTTLVVFGCFAAFSAHQGVIGQTSCGCFGQLSVNPWQALALDIVVLSALILARPNIDGWKKASRSDLVLRFKSRLFLPVRK